MKQLNPYIGFNGQCNEAMNFYKDIFGGELIMQQVSETPMADKFPESQRNIIMHSQLTNGPVVIMGTDMVMPGGFTQGNNISIALNLSSVDEMRQVFKQLSAGGQVKDEIKKQFWGAYFGAVLDKFGINWMLNCDEE